MAGSNSNRVNITGRDLLHDVQRRLLHEERRPQIRTASDLLGPGIGPRAIQLFDWNDDSTAFNGLFYSEPGAQNGPDPTRYWMGLVETNADGYGYQRVLEYRNRDNVNLAPEEWVRTFASGGGTLRTYSTWANTRAGQMRNVVASQLGVTVGPFSVTSVITSVVVPFPVNGYKYRAQLMVQVSNATAGDFTEIDLRQGVGAVAGGSPYGTIFADCIIDQRVAALREGTTVMGEYVYTGATGQADWEIVATLIPSASTSSAQASGGIGALLTVDEIHP